MHKASDNTEVTIPCKYSHPTVPIISPVLSAYYAFSPELENKMSRIRMYNFEQDYLDCQARRTVLESGLADYTVNINTGKFPKYMFLMLSTLDRVGGDETLSLTKFEQSGLEKLDVLVDNDSILGYPLTGIGLEAINFYDNFLRATNR